MENKIVKAPRFMVAAPKSGTGKTFVTCGLLRLLTDRGLRVSAFKCGPDYIDPMFHKTVLGLPSKNLDTFFTGGALTRILFAEGAEGSDISVMEGVMGFFDGMGKSGMEASSYDLAVKTETPVVLVLEARGMSRSIVPMVKGFLEYGEVRNIRGVILNRISAGIFPRMKEWIEAELPVKVLGYLPECPDALWESRHLGLVQPEEILELKEQVGRVAAILRETVDVEALLALAEEAPDLSVMSFPVEPLQKKVRIGVARDPAFSFYYEDNFNLLKKMGAEIRYFSPMADSELPEADGLIFGGGYPELYGKELSSNQPMLDSLRKAAAQGMPILAECGGFMYLQESLTDKEGNTYPMAGILPGSVHMTKRLVRFGYITLHPSEEGPDTYLTDTGSIRGHEFHYFDSTENGSACIAKKPTGNREWECMAVKGNVMAGFPHLFYYSNPDFLRNFLLACADYAG